jgi:hypothetical protein
VLYWKVQPVVQEGVANSLLQLAIGSYALSRSWLLCVGASAAPAGMNVDESFGELHALHCNFWDKHTHTRG